MNPPVYMGVNHFLVARSLFFLNMVRTPEGPFATAYLKQDTSSERMRLALVL